MPPIADLIIKKREEDIKKEVEKRGERITEVRGKLIELLKGENLTIQDANIALKQTQEQIGLAMIEKLLTDVV